MVYCQDPCIWASGIAQQVKVLSAKLNDQTFAPGAHLVEEEN